VVNGTAEAQENNTMASTKDMVAEQLTDTPVSIKDLVEATGKSDSTVRKAVKELVTAGDAVEVDTDSGKGFTTRPANTRKNHGYARNTSKGQAADERDEAIVEVFSSSDSPLKLSDIAEALSITTRAARHGVWRLGRKGVVHQPERGSYELVDAS
jgi:predicted ArsR family transcriptional regulator